MTKTWQIHRIIQQFYTHQHAILWQNQIGNAWVAIEWQMQRGIAGVGADAAAANFHHNIRTIRPITDDERSKMAAKYGKPVADYPLVALDDVPQAGWFGRVWDAIRLWFKSL